ncbi:phosphoglycerate mutase-like protein [Aaosphaeria arxii CBS 175.79]|uniref:Phosphoglycerate mutase-like protein n=1 Tax=Aaosphaeria arxii CBS 175.79 TaxID=1450172 RepID=A0A6A5XIM1_9PLEO|nr:phosphoglycerate mutase-like protein [Aaosphaeria arxii CBS 175.79]KAF2012706.1 phosphoglycerate mutase-like protein [Aaosphaeria arxii CBS 175.79]
MQHAVKLSLLSLLASAGAEETVLGAYIYHRHGDRTPKAISPALLTTLGYEQVHASGQYWRDRYLSGPQKISGVSEDVVKLSQIAVTASVNDVLQNSAMGFTQGLYPPVGQEVQTLANGNNVQAPLNGYQLIPVNTISSGASPEAATWLQGDSDCSNAKISSNSYFDSKEYQDLSASTKDFYASLNPVVNATLPATQVNFKNAYTVYDLINVATIHNQTIPSSDLLTNSTLLQLHTLANAHEWGLAYNASSPMRAVSGMQLAGEILDYMNSTITSGLKGSTSNKIGVQFGAYATFLSFFGLADLPKASTDFTGIVDYASSMAFELFTTADVSTSNGFPKSADDISVRFLFHNGTASNTSTPSVYPLFGGSATSLSWKDFASSMSKFAIRTNEEWCTACGNSTGTCAAYAPSSNNANSNEEGKGGSHMSAAIGGVIGAFVTLAVVMAALLAVMLIGGVRFASKKTLAGVRNGSAVGEEVKTKA